LKTEEFIKFFSLKLFFAVLLLFLFSNGISGLDKHLKLSAGAGWKNDVNPVYSFSSASEIFNRKKKEGGAIFLFGADGGIQSSKESGFSLDGSLNGELSMMSLENSTLDSLISGGYFFPANENNLFRLSLSFHNSMINYSTPESLYIDTTLSLAHIYFSDSIYLLFFKLSTSWYKSTSELLNYLNGFFTSFESSGRIFPGEHFFVEGTSSFSISFFDDQVVEYYRHKDTYYGQLFIDGRFFSFSKGLVFGFDVGSLSVPLSFRYFYSRSFSSDIHRMMFWSDMDKNPLIHEKTRVDNTIEMNLKVIYDFTEQFGINFSYLAHRNFSNVGDHYADYGDFNRVIHYVSAGVSYEF
jgi:hypothetical protein